MLKKIGVICLCAILTLGLCVGCNKKNKKNENNENNEKDVYITEDGASANQSAGIIGKKEVDGFEFVNTSLVTKDEVTTFVSYMTNKNNETINVSKVKVIMKNDKNEEIISLELVLGKELEVNKTTELSAILYSDLSKVKSIEYEIIR